MYDRLFLKRLSYGLGAIIVVFTTLFLLGCSEDDEMSNGENPKTDRLQGLPEDIKAYTEWTRINAAPIPEKEDVPHQGVKNVYMNQSKAVLAPDGKQVYPYPNGSIVVKEITPSGGNFVNAIAVMRKVAGSDPEHNDWKFIKYSRESESAAFTVLAQDEMC